MSGFIYLEQKISDEYQKNYQSESYEYPGAFNRFKEIYESGKVPVFPVFGVGAVQSYATTVVARISAENTAYAIQIPGAQITLLVWDNAPDTIKISRG